MNVNSSVLIYNFLEITGGSGP